jgi:hypothetical protein
MHVEVSNCYKELAVCGQKYKWKDLILKCNPLANPRQLVVHVLHD